MIKSYLSCCVYWLENLHRLYRDRISFLRRILQEITVMRDIKCRSVRSGRLVIVLFFIREKNCSHSASAAKRCCHFKPKWSENMKLCFSNSGYSLATVTENVNLLLISHWKLNNSTCRYPVFSSGVCL